MILHLLIDEKFSDYVVSQFSAKSMQSDFAIVSFTREMKHFHHVNSVLYYNQTKQEDLDQLLEHIQTYNAVVFHGLFEPWQDWLLERIPSSIKVAWSVWGGEIYSRPDSLTSFLSPLTKIIAYIYHLKRKSNKSLYIIPRESFQRIDYCLTYVNEEYEFCVNYLQTNFKHLHYTYYTLEEMIGYLKNSRCEGNNIWLGNSATIENNHLESLLRLKRIGIGNRKIVMPLSYGIPWIRNLCLKVGYGLFGNRFTPLVEFIPREEYNAKMLDCAVMIQGHLREQAHGNIVTGLWLGMRVYLSENGIDYKHFKQLGCKVFSIERDLKSGNPDTLLPLSDADIAYNRNILLNTYSAQSICAMNKDIVNELA